VREPFILGSLWNTIDRPPTLSPTDAVSKRKIRTIAGHELEFDDLLQSVTLSSNSMSTLTLNLEKAEISTPTATVTIGKAGDVTIKAATKLTLDAPVIEIKAGTILSMKSQGPAMLKANALLALQGKPVKIN
jgi:hypothetical protein